MPKYLVTLVRAWHLYADTPQDAEALAYAAYEDDLIPATSMVGVQVEQVREGNT